MPIFQELEIQREFVRGYTDAAEGRSGSAGGDVHYERGYCWGRGHDHEDEVEPAAHTASTQYVNG